MIHEARRECGCWRQDGGGWDVKRPRWRQGLRARNQTVVLAGGESAVGRAAGNDRPGSPVGGRGAGTARNVACPCWKTLPAERAVARVWSTWPGSAVRTPEAYVAGRIWQRIPGGSARPRWRMAQGLAGCRRRSLTGGVWLVTRGAQVVVDGQPGGQLAAATVLWGFGKTAGAGGYLSCGREAGRSGCPWKGACRAVSWTSLLHPDREMPGRPPCGSGGSRRSVMRLGPPGHRCQDDLTPVAGGGDLPGDRRIGEGSGR